MNGLRSQLRNWHRLAVVLGLVMATVAVACGPAAPTPTATAPPPTPTRAAVAPTATPTTAPVTTVATPTPTRAAGPTAVVATPTPTAAAVGPGIRAKEGVKRGGILRVPASTKPALFDLHQSDTYANTQTQGHRYDGLLRLNPLEGNRTVTTDLASSWEMAPDGLSYTYHLRSGVKFHDGSTMTADDVVASYSRIIFPPQGLLSPRKALFAAVTKVEAVDPLTVRFVLKRPSAVIPAATASAWNVIVPKKVLEANNNNLRTIRDYPGTGPFRLVTWAVEEKIVSERFPDYWNKGLPYVDAVHILEIASGNATNALFTGKGDLVASNAPEEWQRAKQSKGVFIAATTVVGNPRTIFTNPKRPFFSDPRVRRAIHLVVNRQAISAAALATGTTAPFGGPWLPPSGVWDRPVSEIEKLPGYRPDKSADIAEAKRLMVAAGYPNGIKDLDILSRSPTGLQTEVVAPALLEQLSVLGITAKIRTADTSAWAPEMARGGFDFGIGYVNQILDDPSGTWAAWFGTGAGFNYGGYSNPKIDKIIEQLDLVTDFKQRLALVREGETILEEDPPMLFWGWLTFLSIHASYVKDLYDDRNGLYDGGPVKLDTVWLDK